ncbi:MAG: response regulator [Proteobacteria bacterium]|nr:response regulator [Pseudomonadota bacterium]
MKPIDRSTSDTSTSEPACILIADDNPNNLKVLSTMLEAGGYDVRVALDGAQALSSIRQLPPDLVMLDIHMPEMDGYQVCDAMKKEPALKTIPVIFISALSEPFNKVMGFQKGAVDYIEKPFHLEEVEARVKTHLKLVRFQKQLLEKAESSEQRFRLTFENAAVGIAHIRSDGSFFRVNKSFCQIMGYDEKQLYHMSVKEVSHPEEWEKNRSDVRALFSNEIHTIRRELRFINKEGKAIWGRVTVSMARDSKKDLEYGIIVMEDITDRMEAEENRKKMELQLRQAQRMEAIGTLAGGIAHDFNNILGVIMGYTDLLRQSINTDLSEKRYLEAIQTASNRAKDLVGQILTSCRQAEQEKKPIQMEHIVKEILNLLHSSLPAFIEIKTDIQKCKSVLADPTQIHQVVMNLCTNAFHAMETHGGTLGISLKTLSLYQGLKIHNLSLIPGEYNLLEVSDTGSGIPPHQLERIFEPYFTTKPKGKGTGLGLSVVHGIVKSHGGNIFVYSEENSGSCFKVYLPCLDKKNIPLDIQAELPLSRGSESILIVDDDLPYLEMMTALLTNLGYQVTATQDSQAALEMIQKRRTDFHCLITDMTMPRMSGAKLTAKVLEKSPDLPVIMFTGFSEIITRESAQRLGIKAFLMKPVVASTVASTLRSVLDGKIPID